MDGHTASSAGQVMRLGTDFMRIKSKSGKMPDWNPEEKVTRKDRKKIKRIEARHEARANKIRDQERTRSA